MKQSRKASDTPRSVAHPGTLPTGSLTRRGRCGLQRWRGAMEHYVGLDVSLKRKSICVVNQSGAWEL